MKNNIYSEVKTLSLRFPEAIAFKWFQGNDIFKKSYKDFFIDINSVSRFIEETFIDEKHIGVVCENTYDTILNIFSVVSTGKCAVLLDGNSSDEENSILLAQSDTKVVLRGSNAINIGKTEKANFGEAVETNSSETDRINFGEVTEINTRIFLNDKENISDINFENAATSEDIAFIIFTSGSTGNKKAVMLNQASLCDMINQAGVTAGIDVNVDLLLGIPLFHMFGVYVMMFNMGHGATTCLLPNVRYFKKALSIYKPSCIESVPMMFEFIYKEIWKNIRKLKMEKRVNYAMKLSSVLLRVGIDIRRKLFKEIIDSIDENFSMLVCGGASINDDIIRFFDSIGIEIGVGYGLSEMGGIASVNCKKAYKIGSVGKPLKGVKVRVRDGEIQLKGPGVTSGYYKDEEETRKIFDENWLKTGDLGYVDKKGFLYITGRIKNLIILSNGENISPEEIEKDLQGFEGIDEVIVRERFGKIFAEIYSKRIEEQSEEMVKKYIKECIDSVNRKNRKEKYIEDFEIRSAPFEKTNTMKIKRGSSYL